MSLRWGMLLHTFLSFQNANIMNRHVVTVTCRMILRISTSINTLWDSFRIYPYPFYLLLYRLSYLRTDPTPIFDSDRVVRSLIQDCGQAGIPTPMRLFALALCLPIRLPVTSSQTGRVLNNYKRIFLSVPTCVPHRWHTRFGLIGTITKTTLHEMSARIPNQRTPGSIQFLPE